MKRIFVGSSSEALPYARAICEVLALPGIDVRMWDQFFHPGYVAIEAIEEVTRKCSGAVFVASPDEIAKLRGREVRLPRANVILELGILSASFGRPSIALCKFTEAELPTDLSGFTYLSLGDYAIKTPADVVSLPSTTVERLQEWARGLQDTLDEVPRAKRLHGYSGRWTVALNFRKWRHLEICGRSYAKVTGRLLLSIPFDGQSGHGTAHGELCLNLVDVEEKLEPYTASVLVMDEIEDVSCFSDASMQFMSKTFMRSVTQEEGTPWVSGNATPVWPSANRFAWSVRPREDCLRTLVGIYKTEDERSVADVILVKI